MEKKELKTLLKAAMTKNPSVNFADTNSAASNGLKEFYGVAEGATMRDLRGENFAVIEEVIDEILPKKMTDVMGQWAQVKGFGRDEEVKFVIKNIGKKRAMLAVAEGARGGIYQARRLDDKELRISCKTYTAGAFITLEEIILGTRTLAELLDLIVEAMQQLIYGEVVKALRGIAASAPAVNKTSGAGVDKDLLKGVIHTVGGYASPVIVCFSSFAENLLNDITGTTPNIGTIDLEEIRNTGYVSKFFGTPVVVLPNYILDEVTNATWAFSEKDAFILPTGGKPVYVAFKGDGYLQENQHPTGSRELQYHKMMGVNILAFNNLGIYTDTEIATAEAGNYIY